MRTAKGQILGLLILLTSAFMHFGCATPTWEQLQERRDQGNAAAAAYAAEGFTLDHRSPDSRPARAWQFYYKNCALVSRNPYPSKTEYECADPR